MDSPIASLDLFEVTPGGIRIPIRVEISHPYPDGRGTWACTTSIDGLNGKPTAIYGADSLQALCLAIRHVREHLEWVLERGNRLVDAVEDSDFPLEAYFKDSRK
jgi:hypothetical protein